MSFKSRIVLIVDDSSEDRELLRRYLQCDRESIYTLLEAELGQQGLELWQQHQPDVVLLDYQLPDFDGLTFLTRLQTITQSNCLPVVMLTGQGNEASAVKTIKAGAQDYLTKGQITPERLQLSINDAIETVQLRNQLQQRIEQEQRIVQQMHHELAQRQQIEVALYQSEERFRQLAENIDAVFWITDFPSRQVRYVSPACKRLWDLDPDYLCADYRNWLNLLHPEDRKVTDTAFQSKAMAGTFDEEYRIILPDRQTRWVRDRCFPLRNQDDQIYRFTGIVEDITQRKQSEAALQESEERYRQLIELCPDGIFVQADSRLVFANQAALNMFGAKTTDELFGKPILDLVSPAYREIVVARMEQLRQGQPVPPLEEQFLRLDGAVVDVEVAAIPFLYNGQLAAQVAVRDISERKALAIQREELLQQEQAARKVAEHANRVKDEFLAVLSHELRSPLNPILGWTKLLQSRQFDAAETAEALATIERNVKLQIQLVDDLLDIGRILRGKLSLNPSPVNFSAIIEAALDTVRTAAQAKSIAFNVALSQVELVMGDFARLQQVVWNLLSNAIKFTSEGGQVTINLKQVNHQAELTVVDTGKGIHPDFLPHLYESFRQEDSSITRRYGGLGLGLAIVRQLVEAHGGTIQAESAGEGQGATFTVQLPLFNAVPEGAQSEQPPAALDLTGIRILAVDDDRDTLDLIAIALRKYGAVVKTFATATEVLTALSDFQPHVLISDISMPDLDGYALIQQIRAYPVKGNPLPAIALTAHAREEDQQRALSNGYQRHITKPLDPEQLVGAVMTLVQPRSNLS
jgi:PAS domain S-box-containing protein